MLFVQRVLNRTLCIFIATVAIASSVAAPATSSAAVDSSAIATAATFSVATKGVRVPTFICRQPRLLLRRTSVPGNGRRNLVPAPLRGGAAVSFFLRLGLRLVPPHREL